MSEQHDDANRRASTRVPVEMWVEEHSADAVYFQRTSNLSAGGLYLENSVPHAVGTRMVIRFRLPSEDVDIQTSAEIVKIEQSVAFGMHLRFLDLPAGAAERIALFVAQQATG